MTSKRSVAAAANVDRKMEYGLNDAVQLVKANATAKFDETVELILNLGVDPKQADQNIRLTTSLPHGTGRKVKVLALTRGAQLKEAEEAGADFVGSDEYIQKLEGGWADIDVIVATPDMMPILGKLGKILGPKGLMPNPKSGTVSPQIGKAVREIKAGRIEVRVDKAGVLHAVVGKASFEATHLAANIQALLGTVLKAKPTTVKGTYLKKATLCSTMGPGVKLHKEALA